MSTLRLQSALNDLMAHGYNPGRLGDSPVVGAGGYADPRWGACASTGTGEVTVRTSAARSVVLYMKMGMGVSEVPVDFRVIFPPPCCIFYWENH